ncbi:hypothetical protein ACJRO7_017982 [Eucalyptus globulus]|uniref:Uncharacterized protein n=1 Tax=Eucalyptus globulus TaxID=34317 RepID=A0ABD3KS32_EUCGL
MATTKPLLLLLRLPAAVRLETKRAPPDGNGGIPLPPASSSNLRRPALSLSKPSWVVRTESNVHREARTKPEPPCVVCRGSGRIDCHRCRGKGRTNHVHLKMLPKGEWPKWCRTCGGSGLEYCSRCLGTGEYRYIMGFQFMKRETKESADSEKNQNEANEDCRSTADRLLNGD